MREMVHGPRQAMMDVFGAATRFLYLDMCRWNVNFDFVCQLKGCRNPVEVEAVGSGLLSVVEVRPSEVVEGRHRNAEGVDEVASRWRHGCGSQSIRR
jgi:hypothetical protein